VTQTRTLTERLLACYTGALHDVMRAQGLTHFVLPREMRPLDPAVKLAGPIMTVSGRTGVFDAHETLLGWTGLPEVAAS
jgi:4-hydroxy-4-methyl-2-oxoglutarate aldolase